MRASWSSPGPAAVVADDEVHVQQHGLEGVVLQHILQPIGVGAGLHPLDLPRQGHAGRVQDVLIVVDDKDGAGA